MSNDTTYLNLSATTIASSTTATVTSIFGTKSPLLGLLWFETIAACFAYGLGFLGNLLSLAVFYSQKEFRKISTGLLFICMSISNVFHLWTLAIEFLTIYSVVMFQSVFCQCQLTYYIQNISRALSTYYMVTVAIDRLIRSEFPMRSKQICTKRNVLLVTIVYLVIFCLFWSFFLYPYVAQNPITGGCSFSKSPTLYYFITFVHVPVRAVFVCFIPVLVMLGANIRMLFNIRQSKNRVTNATNAPSSDANASVATSHSKPSRRRMTAIDRMLYYMMVANVSIFVITQIPFHLYSCIKNNLIGLEAFTATLIRAMLLIWSSLYFGIGFYFYCLASPLFRQKFAKIFKKLFLCQALPDMRGADPTMFVG